MSQEIDNKNISLREIDNLYTIIQNKHFPNKDVWLNSLNEFGEYLDDKHPVAKEFQEIFKKLTDNEELELVIHDTDEINAAYLPNFHIVYITKGILKLLLNKGLNLKKDHIAAIFAHELSHAEVLGEDYLEYIKNTSFIERRLKKINHADEYEADRLALIKLSLGGYNSHALLDVLTLISIRCTASTTHPELIDRVRNVEDILFDDSTPLFNTSKEYKNLQDSTLDWAKSDSSRYKEGEATVQMNSKMLSEKLQEVQNPLEILQLNDLLDHVKKIEYAKEYMVSHSDYVKAIVKKLILWQAIRKYKFPTGSFNPAIYSNSDTNKMYHFLTQYNTVKKEYGIHDDQQIIQLMNSQSYRTHVQPISLTEDRNSIITSNLDNLSRALDEMILISLTTLKNTQTDDISKYFIACIEKQFLSGQISTEILEIVFKCIDANLPILTAPSTNLDQYIRPKVSNTNHLVNLRDSRDKEFLYSIIGENLVAAVCQNEYANYDYLFNLIITKSHLSQAQVDFITSFFIESPEGDMTHALYKKFTSFTKSELFEMIKALPSIEEFNRIHFSPVQDIHSSYIDSFNLTIATQKLKDYKKVLERYSELMNQFKEKLIVQIILLSLKPETGAQLILNDLVSGHEKYIDSSLNSVMEDLVLNTTLSFEEWEIIAPNQNEGAFEKLKANWLLRQYLNSINNKLPPDPNIVAQLKTVNARYLKGLSLIDYITLIENIFIENGENLNIIISKLDNFRDDQYIKIAEEDLDHLLNSLVNLLQTSSLDSLNIKELKKLIFHICTFKFKNERKNVSIDSLLDSMEFLFDLGINVDESIFGSNVTYIIRQSSSASLTKLLNFFQKHEISLSERFIDRIAISITCNAHRKFFQEISSDTAKILTELFVNPYQWVKETIHDDKYHDALIMLLYEVKPIPYQEFISYLRLSPDNLSFKKNTFFDHTEYSQLLFLQQNSSSSKPFSLENLNLLKKLSWEGSHLSTTFKDILRRRYPFPFIYDTERRFLEFLTKDRPLSLRSRPNIVQHVIGKELLAHESEIFDMNKSLEKRIEIICNIIHLKTVVRDVYLEAILLESLESPQSSNEKLTKYRLVIPLLTDDSQVRINFAVHALQLELYVNQDVFSQINSLDLINFYLPKKSFAKNYFLTILENNIYIKTEDMMFLQNLRITPEGKTDNLNNAPLSFLFNNIAQFKREEKKEVLLWILTFSQKKPDSILKFEKELDGSLDSLQSLFASLTNDERSLFIKRFLLGEEGILDLDNVNQIILKEQMVIQQEFISSLVNNLFEKKIPASDLLKKVFSLMVKHSHVVRATQIITTVINKIYSKKFFNQELSAEETIVTILSELGVVGKKTAQILSELQILPESYTNILKREQNDSLIVTKYALFEIAKSNGLLDESAPIRLIGIGSPRGSASNKQAYSVRVKIQDNHQILPIGEYELIAKFKRPSASKNHGILHDVQVLTNVINDLVSENAVKNLPKNFVNTVVDVLRRELQFSQEVIFNEKLAQDIVTRNQFRQTKMLLPKIIFSSDDLVLETIAEGKSLREIYDLHNMQNFISPDMLAKVEQELIFESLSQLILTGNVHLDLHPGNIFVDKSGTITLIDLGMHLYMQKSDRFATLGLLIAIFEGNERILKNVLVDFGWHTPIYGLKKHDFSNNIFLIIGAIHENNLSTDMQLILLALSKLATYSHTVDKTALINYFLQVIPNSEIQELLMYLYQKGVNFNNSNST